jgi:uncharacterized protein (DUF2062 family)
MSNFLTAKIRRTVQPILNLLRRGSSPDRLAASVALGAVIGLFPVVGITTAVCAAAALLLRFNLPAIQAANYLVYPLQLLLVFPFVHLGAALFQVPPPPFSAGELATLLSEDFWGTLVSFSAVIGRACVAWLTVAVPGFAALFFPLAYTFRRIAGGRSKSPSPSDLSSRNLDNGVVGRQGQPCPECP